MGQLRGTGSALCLPTCLGCREPDSGHSQSSYRHSLLRKILVIWGYPFYLLVLWPLGEMTVAMALWS